MSERSEQRLQKRLNWCPRQKSPRTVESVDVPNAAAEHRRRARWSTDRGTRRRDWRWKPRRSSRRATWQRRSRRGTVCTCRGRCQRRNRRDREKTRRKHGHVSCKRDRAETTWYNSWMRGGAERGSIFQVFSFFNLFIFRRRVP